MSGGLYEVLQIISKIAGKMPALLVCFQQTQDLYAQLFCLEALQHLVSASSPIKVKAIATPGHTVSHNAYLVNGTHLLTGDSLLIRGCGRTDFQSGNAGMMYDAIAHY
jgi:glyoxylase-like metal-dependent hydrolase (beta-lactamase superfamily II)